MPKVLMVIAPDHFRDEEYAHPKEVLESRGATVSTASLAPGPCRGKLGMIVTAEVALSDTRAEDYDAVVFVGGAGASVFFDDPDAHRLARAMADSGRVIGAICIAPSTLAHAGLLDGLAATSFESQEDDLVLHGARYTGTAVEIAGRTITANGPAAARDFGEALADALELP